MSKKSYREREFERLCILFKKTPPKKFNESVYIKLCLKENQLLKEKNSDLKRKLELKEKQNERKAKRLKSNEEKLIDLVKKCGEGFQMINQQITRNDRLEKAMIQLTREKVEVEKNLKSLEERLRKEYNDLENNRRKRLENLFNEKYFELQKHFKDDKVTEQLRTDLDNFRRVCFFLYKKNE